MFLPGRGTPITIMNSKQPYLSAYSLNKTKTDKIPLWMGEIAMPPAFFKELLAGGSCWRKVLFSLRICPLVDFHMPQWMAPQPSFYEQH